MHAFSLDAFLRGAKQLTLKVATNALLGLLLLGVLCLLPCSRAYSADAPTEPLRNAASILALSAHDAGQRLNVAVAGVVTFTEPAWDGQFIMQDATGGVFVENHNQPSPEIGDLIELTGVTHPGAFAPIISAPRWRVMGNAPLPQPKPVLIENLVLGVEDGLRVEIAGVVRSVIVGRSQMRLELAVGGYRLQVWSPLPQGIEPGSLMASRVLVRGTTATHYNQGLRHLTSVAVYVPRWQDLTILQPAPSAPFKDEIIPLKGIGEYRRGSESATRVHVQGTVTAQRVGEDIFIQDATGGLHIDTLQQEIFAVGEQVEAIGFLEYEGHLPLLRDATLRRTGRTGTPIHANVVPLEEVKQGLHHAAVITVRGEIVDHGTLPLSRQSNHFHGMTTTLLIQGQGLTFTVEHEARQVDQTLAAIPIGSVVEMTGVCFCEVDGDERFKMVRLLLSNAEDLHILSKPSWLTAGKLLIGLAVLSLVLVVVGIWSLTVSKKNAALSFVIRQLEIAQGDLQHAHDTLEQKVVERSAQLQIEMSERKTAEVQFRAVLAERTRLARDLHDTLEQTLTGIALQLDTAARLFQGEPIRSHHHLQLARNWLRQSQVGIRRSIWDLRSRELEQFDLAIALRRSAEQLVDGSDIQLGFATSGDKRPLSEVVEENVLRIGQEALTNIAKHAHATKVKITLNINATSLQLVVEDNGAGFDPQNQASGEHGFGLLGMSERAKRLAGRIVIQSERGQGTTITAEIPLDPPKEAPLVHGLPGETTAEASG